MKKTKFDANSAEMAQYDYRRNPSGEKVFQNLQDLIDFLTKYDTSDCYFRGQSGLWDVVSSLHRHRNKNFEKACNISKSALEWLKNNQFIGAVVNDNDDILFAIAQHYGCPTDLIDITSDYRTAAYFASSENDTHEEKPLGCVWVFSIEEIERLRDFIIKTVPGGPLSQFPKALVEKFVEDSHSPLIQINVPQLSRLKSQNGAFLWDIAGALQFLLDITCVGTRLVFRHTCDEKSIFADDEERLFPFPNQLESEIMRAFKERIRVDGLPEYYGMIGSAVNEKEGLFKNGLLAEIVDNSKGTIFIPLPDLFSPSFGEYEWIKRNISQDKYNNKRIDSSNRIDCHLPFSTNGTLALTQYILKCVNENSLTDLLIIFYKDNEMLTIRHGDEEILIEIVITLSNYLYSNTESPRVFRRLVS